MTISYQVQVIKRAEAALEDAARADVEILMQYVDTDTLALLALQIIATPGEEGRQLLLDEIERTYNRAVSEYVQEFLEEKIADIREADKSLADELRSAA